MITLTRLSRLAALPLAATLLVGCGGGSDSGDSGDASASSSESAAADGGDYCDQLKQAKTDFEAFGSGTPSADDLQTFFDTVHTLSDSAPSEVEDSWKTVDTSVTALEDALDKAGLKLSDFANLQSGELPKGVTAQDVQPILQAAQGLATEENSTAFDEITKHGQEECDVDLDTTASESPSPSE